MLWGPSINLQYPKAGKGTQKGKRI